MVGDRVLAQGKDTITTEPTQTLAVISSKCSGGIFSEHWIDGQRCGPLQGAIAEKAVPFPSVARRSQFFLVQSAARACVRIGHSVRRRPGLKVLFTTGYTRNAIVHHGRLDSGVEMIGKPFSIDELTRKAMN